MKNIAIIPARGGSKRIPRKNVKEFLNKPMIAYAIDAAFKTQLFDHIVVSSDDDEIIETSIKFGAISPFKRPNDLADDFTGTTPVIVHAIQSLQSLGYEMDHVCCIYPCVPLISVEDIKVCFEKIKAGTTSYCYPVSRFPSPIQRALRMNDDQELIAISPEYRPYRSQDLEVAFYDVGQFYWKTTQAWLQQNNGTSSHYATGYEIPSWRAVDIDNIEDWQRAELLYRAIHHLS